VGELPVQKGVSSGEKTACQLYAGLLEKVPQEIGDPLGWELTLSVEGC
jgi:hypothetical protein